MPVENQAPRATAEPILMDLQSPHQHQQRERKPSKAYHVVPQDDAWMGLQEPLSASASYSDDSLKSSGNRRRSLASSRVERDKLMRVMEDLVLKEAELASAYELFDYTRKKSIAEHELIVDKLTEYQELLNQAQQREQELRDAGEALALRSPREKERWEQTKSMVNITLPELLTQLDEKIDINGAKIRHIQKKIDEIRAQRLALREDIAEKEEDIALALASTTT